MNKLLIFPILLLLAGLLCAANIITPISSVNSTALAPSHVTAGTNGQASKAEVYSAIYPNYTDHYFWVNISGPVASNTISNTSIKMFNSSVAVLNASLFKVNTSNSTAWYLYDNITDNASWDGENGSATIDNYTNISYNVTNFKINTTPTALGDGERILILRTKNWQTAEFNFTSSIVNIDPVIAACGSVILSGSYTLTGSLVSSTAATCLNVTAADVSIDCNNFNITGDDTSTATGIWTNQADVNISDCQIQNYTYGINYNSATGGYMNNNTINASFPSLAAAIYLSGSTNNTVINKTTTNATTSSNYGVWTDWANNITVANSSLFSSASSAHGVYFKYNTTNSTVFNDTITTTASSATAVYFGNSGDTTVGFNVINYTNATTTGAAIGTWFYDSSNNTMVNSQTTGGSNRGLEFDSGSNNTIKNTSISSTSNTADFIATGSFNVFSNDTITATANQVFYIDTAYNNTIANSTILGSGTAKGVVFNSNDQNNTIYNNTINVNGSGSGIYLSGSTTNFTTITLNNINVSVPSAKGINITSTASQAGSNIITNNTIWVNATSPGVGIIISIKSGNNSIYYNNFTSGYYFINSSNSTNQFNTTVSSTARGNAYANITAYAILDANLDGFGDTGTQYPVNSTLTPGVFTADTNGSDWGPITSQSLNVGSCKNLTVSAAYNITANLTSTTIPACINITASHISLNCYAPSSYQTIIGNNTTSTTGIWTNQNDVNITNCQISNYSTGIYMRSVLNGFLNNDTINSSFVNGFGILLAGSSNLTVINNSKFNATNNSVSLFNGTGNNITLANSSLWSNSSVDITLVWINGSSANWSITNNSILSDSATSSPQTGIGAGSSTTNNMLINNNTIISLGAGLGIQLASGANETISNNTINTTSGIAISFTYSGTSNNTIFNNTINATAAGISMFGTGTNQLNNISFNTMNLSSGTAIVLGPMMNSTISSNNITDVTGAGIQTTAGARNLTIVNNTVNVSGSVQAIDFTGTNNTLVANNTISSSNRGLSVQTASNNNTFLNNTLNIKSGAVGRQQLSYNNSYINNTINNPPGSSQLYSGFNIGASSVCIENNGGDIISGNYFNMNVTNDVGIVLNSVFNETIANNTFFGNGTTPTGINVQCNTSNSTFTNNTFLSNGLATSAVGIVFTVNGLISKNNTFTNNTFLYNGSSPAAIRLYNTSAQNNTFIGNVVNATNATGATVIIDLQNATGNMFYNNTFLSKSTSTIGLITLAGTLGANGNVFSNTTINATGGMYGIKINNGSNNTIANGTINTSTTGGYGILISNASTNNTIYNNTIWTNGTMAHGIFLINTTVNSTNISYNTINVSAGKGALPATCAINFTNTSFNIVFNNTIWANTTQGTGICADTRANQSNFTANNITGFVWVNDTNGSNNYNVSSIGNIYYLTSGSGVWTTGNGTNLTIASPPGWSTSAYQVNTTNFPPYWPNLGSDFWAWTGNSAGGGGSGLYSPVGGPLGFIWQTVVAGNIIPRGSPTGWNWSVWTQGDGILTMNGSPTAWVWSPE